MPKEVNFEREIAKLEFTLSKVAAIPVLGTFGGAAKVCLAIIQTIGGLLALIISIPFLCTEGGRKFASRGGSHFVNGLANILAGVLEGIPIVGSIIYGLRYYRTVSGSDMSESVLTGQEHMLLVGYRILEDHPHSYNNYMTGRTLQEIINEGRDLNEIYRKSPWLAV